MRNKQKGVIAALLFAAVVITGYYYHIEKAELDKQHQIRLKRFSYVTRDPDRRITFSYQTSINQSMNFDVSQVDLASGKMPSDTRLDRQMVIVMGFGSRRMYKGLGCVASIQSHMPFKKIIVYDLGIHPKMVKKLRQMCNVEVRKVDFSKYPKHVRKTENHAWQILELKSILKEYGAFFYIEPDMRLRAPISMLLPYIIKQNGILMDVESDNTTVQVTHPELFRALDMSIVNFKRDFPNAPIGTKFIAAVNNSALVKTLWKPLADCALSWKCIAPFGSEHKDVVPEVKLIHTDMNFRF
ncbi:uncharacterized protein [Amphiura filiformis]|uniref:uncharacterized protein n=1 Tax=Amphiura filiformis TaxID=82378 RepID=UPI003B21BA30